MPINSVEGLHALSLTDRPSREELLQLRQRYVELINALEETRDYNPATLDALTEIFGQSESMRDCRSSENPESGDGRHGHLRQEAA